MITADISAKGNERINNGSNKLTVVSPFAGPTMLTAAKVNPKKYDPPSPIKMRAGLKLWRRKPRQLPANAAARKAAAD